MVSHYGVHVEYFERGSPRTYDFSGLQLRNALALCDYYCAGSSKSDDFLEDYVFGRAEVHRQGMPLLGLEPEMRAGAYGDFIDTGVRRWHAIGEDTLDP